MRPEHGCVWFTLLDRLKLGGKGWLLFFQVRQTVYKSMIRVLEALNIILIIMHFFVRLFVLCVCVKLKFFGGRVVLRNEFSSGCMFSTSLKMFHLG